MQKQPPCLPPALKLHRFVFLLEKKADQELQQALGVTFAQCMILLSLQRNPSCSQQCIAKCRDLTQAAVSRQVESLAGKKLLLRKENEKNRREHVLTLTAKGEETLRKGTEIIEKTFEGLFRKLGSEEMVHLERGIDVLLEAICAQREERHCH